MADNILANILGSNKNPIQSITSIDATLKKMYRLDLDSERRRKKEKEEEKQANKRKEKDKNLLEDILGVLRKGQQIQKKDNIFDKLKNGLIGLIKSGLGSIGGFMSKTLTSALGGKFFEKLLGPVFKNLFKVGGPIFGVVTAALIGWKIGEWLNNNVINNKVKPWAGKVDNNIRNTFDKISGGGATKTGSGASIATVDVKRLIETKTSQLFSPLGVDQLSEGAKEQTQKDIDALKKINDKIKEKRDSEEELAKLKAEQTKEKDPKKAKEAADKVAQITARINQQGKELDAIIASRPGLDQELNVQKRQRGGPITVPGSGSGDKVPMMLPPGSFVMNRNAAAMLQSGGLVPTLLEPGEKVFGPGDVSPMHHLMNSMIPRFQEGGVVGGDTYSKHSEEGILPSEGKTTPKELKVAKVFDNFAGKAAGGEVQPVKKKGIYIEGGREGYDPHFHINRADQANFNRSILDEYVKVNGKALSSGLTVRGGEYGASRDGGRRKHTGIDFAFGGNTQLSLTGAAEWLANKPVSGIGDKTSFKTPVGVFEVIHGTYKGNALPGSYDGSGTGDGGGGGGGMAQSAPQNALDMIMGAVGGMGEIGQALGSFFSSVSSALGLTGENSWIMNSLFGSGPAMATGPAQATTGGGESGSMGGTADTSLTPNRKAMLDSIAMAEGTNKYPDSGYKTMFTGKQFKAPPWVHPRQIQRSGGNASDAAGRYQFLSSTWDGHKLPDFSPKNQDQAALKEIQQKGALGDVDAGRFDKAFTKSKQVWASFPGSTYGQPTKDMKTMVAFAQSAAKKYGGNQDIAKLQTGGVVNMSGSPSGSTVRFKNAQAEFAEMIAEKSAGNNIVVVNNTTKESGTVPISSSGQQQVPPNLPEGPSTIQAAEYFYRLNMGSVF